MSKIESIQINNFKFFDEQEPIKLDGKHLLLYGENGSGKSSIYWALYTLFEATLKDNKEEVEKYFKHQSQHDQSLINIHANSIPASGTNPLHYNSFVKVQTTHAPPKEYKVSLLETDIIDNTVAKEINQASDFITYKVLYKFQDFWNGATMDLANIFINYILPYISFSAKELIRNGETISFSNASAMYEELLIGPGTTTNHKGNRIQVYKNSPENKKFISFELHFNEQLGKLIDFINISAPTILKKLGYDIEFSLHYNNFSHKKADSKYHKYPFSIVFKITSYLGKQILINRPQSFLNEAKITAIAVAIRLSILKYRYVNPGNTDSLRFIVFDDIMISLDMNNRDKLIDYLLNSENGYTTDYQLLFLTHDRSLFYYLKDKIRNNGSKDDWVYKEMFVDTTSSFEKPVIYDYPNKINKAEYFLQKHDYPACGIYLRTSCEELLDKLYPDPLKYEVKINNEGLYESRLQGLNDKINNLEWFCKEESIEYAQFKDLKTYKNVVLNTLAHYDIHSPIYKTELIKILEVLKKLESYKRDKEKPILKTGKTLKLLFTKNDGTIYTIGITLKDKLVVLEKVGEFKRLSNICKVNITYKNDNGVEEKDINIEKKSIKQIVSETCTFLGINNDIIIEDSLIDRNGNAISIKINS